MAATKRKARKTKKAPKLQTIDLGWLPLTRSGFMHVTPKDAGTWLSKDAELWHDFLSDLTKTARGKEREAVGELTYWVGMMVEVASRAIRTGRTVPISSNWSLSYQDPDWNTVRLAGLLLTAASRCDANAGRRREGLAQSVSPLRRGPERMRDARCEGPLRRRGDRVRHCG